MSIAILIVDVYIVNHNGDIVGPGYVRLSGGAISHIGIGEPPEEAQLAELVLGGAGRLLYPGFGAALVYPETYILRDYVSEEGLPNESVLRCIRDMSEEEAYYSSLMAFYEMSLAGYTRIIALSPWPRAVIRALREAGLSGAVLALIDDANALRKALRELPGLQEPSTKDQVVLGIAASQELPDAVTIGGINCIIKHKCSIVCNNKRVVPFGCSGKGVIAPVYPFITPSQLLRRYRDQGFSSLIEGAHRLISAEYTPLDKGARTHITVYDVSEPPSWMGSLELASPYMLTPLARAETLISEGRLVVDGGEHLFLGVEVSEKAKEVLVDVRKRCSKRLG